MTIGVTTVSALRTTVATKIIALTPQHTGLNSAAGWRRVRSIEDVPGPDRSFYVSIVDQRMLEGALFTSGLASWGAMLKVWTAYGNMSDEDYEDLRSSDQNQLWTALSAAGGPTTGLLNIANAEPPWEEGDDSAEGHRWGAHVFRIHYLLQQP